jgi:hypothetical protein
LADIALIGVYDQFLRPTFEAMFHMLHRSAGDEKLQFLVYDALIFVLGMFAEDRMLLFVNFRPTINSMIQAYEQYVPYPPDAFHSIEPHLPTTLSSPLLLRRIPLWLRPKKRSDWRCSRMFTSTSFPA